MKIIKTSEDTIHPTQITTEVFHNGMLYQMQYKLESVKVSKNTSVKVNKKTSIKFNTEDDREDFISKSSNSISCDMCRINFINGENLENICKNTDMYHKKSFNCRKTLERIIPNV